MEIAVISDKIAAVNSHTLAFSKLNFSPTKSRVKTIPRKFTQKRRRLKPKSRTGGGDSEDFWVPGDGGDFMNINCNYCSGGGGGGGGSGGGGGGGDFNMGWSFNWDDSESNSYSDPAFDFVYEVLSWIVLSNCLHFAYKKVVRLAADGFGETAREKVPIGLTSVC